MHNQPVRWLFSWAFGIVALCIGALILVSHVYHPFASHPSLLHVCGRDYQPSGASESREQIESSGVSPFTLLASTPDLFGSSEVWGAGTPSLGVLSLGDHCGDTVWVRTGNDSFKPYAVVAP